MISSRVSRSSCFADPASGCVVGVMPDGEASGSFLIRQGMSVRSSRSPFFHMNTKD